VKRQWTYLLILFVAVMLAALVYAIPHFVRLSRETPEVSRAFAGYGAALVDQRYADAYRLGGQSFADALTYDQFVEQQHELQERFGRLKSVHPVGYNVSGKGDPYLWSAVIAADYVFEKRTLRFDVSFRKENDQWMLYGYREE
jgi:hypothetical protein